MLGGLVGDGQDGGPDAWVLGGQEAHQRHEQEGGVEPVGAAVVGEDAPLVDAFVQMSAWISPAATCQRAARASSPTPAAETTPLYRMSEDGTPYPTATTVTSRPG